MQLKKKVVLLGVALIPLTCLIHFSLDHNCTKNDAEKLEKANQLYPLLGACGTHQAKKCVTKRQKATTTTFLYPLTQATVSSLDETIN